MEDAVKMLQKNLMGSVADRLVIEVRRKLILKDALKEANKEKFCVKKYVKVIKFVKLIKQCMLLSMLKVIALL